MNAHGLRFRNLKLLADRASCSRLDFAMAWNAGYLTVRGVEPGRMRATFSIQHAAVVPQVALKIRQLHASTSSMGSRRAPGAKFSSASCRWASSTDRSASNKFALASSTVSPWEIAAGISSTKQVYPPSDAGSKTAVRFTEIGYQERPGIAIADAAKPSARAALRERPESFLRR